MSRGSYGGTLHVCMDKVKEVEAEVAPHRKEFVKRFIDNLRSGKFIKQMGALRSCEVDNTRCANGVGCETLMEMELGGVKPDVNADGKCGYTENIGDRIAYGQRTGSLGVHITHAPYALQMMIGSKTCLEIQRRNDGIECEPQSLDQIADYLEGDVLPKLTPTLMYDYLKDE